MSKHFAFLIGNADPVFDQLAAIATRNGFDVRRTPDTMHIEAPLGLVEVKANAQGTQIAFSANTPPELQLLKDLYAQRFEKLGLDAGIRWSAPNAQYPLNQTLCNVVSSRQISPNFQRVRLSGDFGDFAVTGAGLHFRFLLGPEGAHWPTLDQHGLTHWPDGAKAWHRPPYSVRKLSSNADWMDVDIVLHAGGRVTEWCTTVQAGDQIAIHGPSGSKQPGAKHLALCGDETALPVILHMIENAPPDSIGHAIVMVRDMNDAQPVDCSANVHIDWTTSTNLEPTQDALKTLEYPTADTHFFFAGERSAATVMRSFFKEQGLASSQFKAASYWTREP